MIAPRCTAEDYIQFLLATPRVFSATEAARVQPGRPERPAHDAYTRLLHRLEPDPDALWGEVRPLIRTAGGAVVIDDTVLDKPFARHMGLVGHHRSDHRFTTGVSWFEAKMRVIRDAVRAYLARPTIGLPEPATA